MHLLSGKPDETWAIKVDRSTNMVCYQQPGHVRAGLTDAYCGPKIIHENAIQLVAILLRFAYLAPDIVEAIDWSSTEAKRGVLVGLPSGEK